MTKDIRLAYDGDEAGVRAAERAISMASKFGIYLSIVDDYHGCKDADELIQKDPELWQKAVRQYRPAMEWLFEKYESKYDHKTERGFQEYCNETKRLIDEIDENETALRERYERIVADRLGISLEAFRAKKVIQNKKKLKRPVVKNTTDRGGVVKNTTPEISKAEKSFASLVICGGVANDDIELIDFDKDELALIFEEKYARLSKSELENEAKALEIVLRKERAEAKRNELGEQIRAAEAAGDEEKMLQLMAEMNKIIRKS
jgi:DNA primase